MQAHGAHASALFGPGTRALTHCNAGGLATGGYGSAVGALRAAWEEGLLEHVWVDETRPLLQGSRLTAWELEALGIPHAVIADSAAAHLMSRGEVDCVVTGADRIAANGDAANKIGTYGLAVARRPSRDPALHRRADLDDRSRRRRPARRSRSRSATAPSSRTRFAARNPAFDVTPAALIAAIVTEEGVHRAPYADRCRARCTHEGDHPRGRVRDAPAAADGRSARSACCPWAAGRWSTGFSTRSVRWRRSTRCISSRTTASRRTSSAGRCRRKASPSTTTGRRRTRTGSARWATSRSRSSGRASTTTSWSSRATISSTTHSPTSPRSGGARACASAVAVLDVGDLRLASQYGVVDVAEDERITSFVEKPADPPSTLAATATYIYHREHVPLVERYLAEGNAPDQVGQLHRLAARARAGLRVPVCRQVARHRRQGAAARRRQPAPPRAGSAGARRVPARDLVNRHDSFTLS